jgi:hypothetical protein
MQLCAYWWGRFLIISKCYPIYYIWTSLSFPLLTHKADMVRLYKIPWIPRKKSMVRLYKIPRITRKTNIISLHSVLWIPRKINMMRVYSVPWITRKTSIFRLYNVSWISYYPLLVSSNFSRIKVKSTLVLCRPVGHCTWTKSVDNKYRTRSVDKKYRTKSVDTKYRTFFNLP